MKIIQQDMLVLEKGHLFHQVNCRGIMGGGIAASLARKFPGLEKDYREVCARYDFDQDKLLGKVFVWPVNENLAIANVFGQGDISRTDRMTSYDATCVAFERIKKSQHLPSSGWNNQDSFFFPFKMGCGLGGGEWSIYSAIIEHYFPNAIICKHNV